MPAAPLAARAVPQRTGGSYVDTSDGDLGASASFRIGMRVSHPKFGDGTIRNVLGGLPPKVVVRFATVGEKTVIATYLQRG